MRSWALVFLAPFFVSACERPDGPEAGAPKEAYPVAANPVEGIWRLHSLNGADARTAIFLHVGEKRFELEGCGSLGGGVPPTNGPRILRADAASSTCAQAAWKQHQALVRLLQSSPEASLTPRRVGRLHRPCTSTAIGAADRTLLSAHAL